MRALICVFIDPRILNKGNGYSYIRAIFRHEGIIFMEKSKYIRLMSRDDFLWFKQWQDRNSNLPFSLAASPLCSH